MKRKMVKPRKSDEVLIRRMNGAREARVCATMMVESEPWIRLKRDFKHAFKMLNRKDVEVYVAEIGGAATGHIVVNMQGPFAGYIQALVVAPECRGRGIGSQLVRFA